MRTISLCKNILHPLTKPTARPALTSLAITQSRAYGKAPNGASQRLESSSRESQEPPRGSNAALIGSDPKYRYKILTVCVLGFTVLAYFDRHHGSHNQNAAQESNIFVSYTLADTAPVSSTTSIFTIVPKAQSDNPAHSEGLDYHGIWSVEIKQPQLQIAREYTPLPHLEGTEQELPPAALRFLIRRELHGEVSGWIHNLPIGAEITVRGPKNRYSLSDNVTEVLFLAGGTGIAPALQLLHGILDSKSGSKAFPKVHIMWANRRRDECIGGVNDTPIPTGWSEIWSLTRRSIPAIKPEKHEPVVVKELEDLKARFKGKLKVDYFVDEEGSFINLDTLKPTLTTQNRNAGVEADSPEKNRLILISGPDGFVNYFAGPKQWKGGREEQGELGGILGNFSRLGWKVWKL